MTEQVQENVQVEAQVQERQSSGMKLRKRDRFWMNFKPYQFIRFVILNLKILKAVDHSKRS